jgi:hypothetical protein
MSIDNIYFLEFTIINFVFLIVYHSGVMWGYL